MGDNRLFEINDENIFEYLETQKCWGLNDEPIRRIAGTSITVLTYLVREGYLQGTIDANVMHVILNEFRHLYGAGVTDARNAMQRATYELY